MVTRTTGSEREGQNDLIVPSITCGPLFLSEQSLSSAMDTVLGVAQFVPIYASTLTTHTLCFYYFRALSGRKSNQIQTACPL